MTLQGKKNYIAVAAFLAVFGGLVAIATFYDLQVSRILTRFSLKEGEYFTSDVFANFFEAAGMLPYFLLRASAMVFAACFFWTTPFKKPIRILLSLTATALAVVFLSDGLKDLVLYPMKHALAYGIEEGEAAIRAIKPTVTFFSYFFAAIFVGLAFLPIRKIPARYLRALALFVIGYFIIDLISTEVVSCLKGYVDRIRFRSMNSLYGQAVGGFDQYTRWYEVTDHADLFRETPLTHYADAFRSFPSGHTQHAGCSYAVIMLIDVFGVTDRKKKAALWIAPILWTGLTGLGRIVAGAHFMSDVLFGGTIPFLLTVIVREVLFRRGSSLKEMRPIRKKDLVP